MNKGQLHSYKSGDAFKFKGIRFLALQDNNGVHIYKLPSLEFCYAWESIDSFKKRAPELDPEIFSGGKDLS